MSDSRGPLANAAHAVRSAFAAVFRAVGVGSEASGDDGAIPDATREREAARRERERHMPPLASAAMRKLAASSNAFAFDLYAVVRAEPGNLAMSPASISAALAMTLGGARGETEAQIRRVMHIDLEPDAVAREWSELLRGLQDPARALKLRIANRLFGEQSLAFEQAFIDQTRDAYGAPLEPTDFARAPEAARGMINRWVEEQTEQRILQLVPTGAIDPRTRLVLVNAIHFLAEWQQPFESYATLDAIFHVSPTSHKTTRTMHATGWHAFGELDGVSALELTYRDGDAVMLLLLPERVDGLESLERSLSASKLHALRASLSPQEVAISLPLFELNPSRSMSLGADLATLGMPDAFDLDRADFTGMARRSDEQEGLVFSDVFHKAFVKVDEKGTEAAAATAMGLFAGLPPGLGAPPRVFYADHPFLFAIIDARTELVLFLGRVSDPTES